MTESKTRKFPIIIILLLILGMTLLCCCPTLVVGVPFMLDTLGGGSDEIYLSESVQEQSEQVEVISEETFNQADSEDFMEEILTDRESQALFEWALNEGYLALDAELGGGAEVAYSDGSVLRGVVYGGVQFLQISSPSQLEKGYVLSRFEGTEESPVWILFNQDGYAAIDAEGIEVFDRDGGSIGEAPFAAREDSLQLASLSPAAAAQCTTGAWDEFVSCIESQGSKLALGSVCAVSLAAGKVACVVGGTFTLGGSCIVAIAGSVVACGVVPGVCLSPALHDDPPQASMSMWSDTGEKAWIEGGRGTGMDSGAQGWIEVSLWKAKLSVSDDRQPDPKVEPPSDWFTAGSGECVSVRVEDCGRNQIERQFCAPDLTEAEQATWQESHPDASMQDPEPPQPAQTEESTLLAVEISYQGRYTGVMSNVVGSGGYGCSSNDDYWSDVVFTYRFNADESVTRVGVVVNGENRSSNSQEAIYVPGDENTYVKSNTTDNGFWQETLYFSNTELRIEKYHQDNAGISGTCTITLQVVPAP